MPTVAELERLEALIERLIPLSRKQRGELIAAEDWNAIVAALIEIGRAALTAGDAETVPSHEHADQVAIGWLDPRLRQLVTGGGLKDPAVETEIRRLQRDLTSLGARIERVGTEVERSRARLDEVATNDLARETLLTRLNRKVLGAENDRGDIADLRGTLRTLETEIARAVQVGLQLENDGQPIDVRGLVDRVGAVEALRDRLTRPDGALLDATALETRLLELQTSFVSQADLTEAIDDVRRRVGAGFDPAALDDAARSAGRDAARNAVDLLSADLRSMLEGRFADLGPRISNEVAAATGSLRDAVLDAARAEIGAAVRGVDAAVRNDLSALVESRLGATSTRIDERLAGIPDLVGSEISQRLDARLPAALADVSGRLDGLGSALTQVREQVDSNASAISEAGVRFEAARRDDAAARAQLRADLLARIGAVDDRLDPRISAAIDEARSVLRTDVQAAVTASRRDLETRLAQVARDAAATEVQVLSTRIRTDLQSIVRQELDANLAGVRGDIGREIAGLGQRVAGLVSAEVTRATADLPRLVSAEVETLRPELERIVDRRLNRPPTR